MGRRVSISQPTVIQTDLAPLSENISIVASDATEQWYYENTGKYSPDRGTTPLTLTPVVKAYDPDTAVTHTPSFYLVTWYETAGGTTAEITNTTDSTSASYVKLTSGALRVKKNVPPEAGVSLRCVVEYIDPRDTSLTHTVEESVALCTNRDATVAYPSIDVLAEKCTPFNPLTAADGATVTLRAKAYKGGKDVTSDTYFQWYAIDASHPSETLMSASEFPCYKSGQGTATLVIDPMYTESITVVCRGKANSSATSLYPSKCIRTVMWDIPKLDCQPVGESGGAVRSGSKAGRYSMIVNMRGQTLSDTVKAKHLLMNWKYRKTGTSAESDAGWGQSVSIDPSALRNTATYSALVSAHVYVLGAWEPVTQDGAVVTQDGETVFARVYN